MLAIRSLLACILLLFSMAVVAQYRQDWRTDIDLIIQRIDSIATKSQKTFSLVKPYHRDKDIREDWYYSVVKEAWPVVTSKIKSYIESLKHEQTHNFNLKL